MEAPTHLAISRNLLWVTRGMICGNLFPVSISNLDAKAIHSDQLEDALMSIYDYS
jgi:hypothetical protein